jgi:AraC family transcriptional regulator
MNPRIETLQEKKLIGQQLTMSLADEKIGELWKSFMPRRNEITSNVNNDLISMAVYSPNYFSAFKLTNLFQKWATIEVANFNHMPNGMETFVLPGGLYAVFNYKGLNTDNSIYQYIFETWLPSTAYLLDNRPHFEVLSDSYKNNDPTSEEEIWIPIKAKT